MTRVFEFLGEAEMEDESHKERQLTDMKGQVVFDRVTFGYTPEKPSSMTFLRQLMQGKRLPLLGRLELVRLLLSTS